MMLGPIDRAFESLMELEGVHSDDPADAGGDTWYGISRRSYPKIGWPPTREEAKNIYAEDFWAPMRLTQVKYYVAQEKLFHMAVNMGTRACTRYLQMVLNRCMWPGARLVVDGVMGPKTLKALNGNTEDMLGQRKVIEGLRWMSVYHYQNLAHRKPSQMKFINGWMNRAIR